MSKLKIRDQSDPNTWYEVPAGGVGVPSGGTAGQVLMKSSSANYADEWADISEAGAMSAWELLWTNASPTSAFAAQTVSLDLSGYDAVCIIFRNQKGSDAGWNAAHICFPDVPTEGMCFNGNGTNSFRITTMRTTGVEFDAARGGSSYGSPTNNNDLAIPSHIYGIKGVNS